MDSPNLTGRQLGQYELLERLGSANSQVYRACQPALQRDVAVKTLTSDVWYSAKFAARFTENAMTIAALEHAHIIPIYDCGIEDNVSYIVMRLLTGGTLAAYLAEAAAHGQTGLPLNEIAALLRPIANALDYLHEHRVIHRSVTPHNIIFDEQGTPFLTGFVIAKLIETPGEADEEGMLYGEPAYMPPEQWRAELPTPAADQYMLGVVAYELLTGQVPFAGQASYEIMRRHLNDAPLPPHRLRRDVPEALSNVVLRALAKHPADRFKSVGAFMTAFEQALEQPYGQHIFISYTREDTDAMHAISAVLRAAGYAVWTDENLTPGAAIWEANIAEAIETASAVVVVLSPFAKQSVWVTRELAYSDLHTIPIFPVWVSGDARSAIPLLTAAAQLIDARHDFDDAMHALVRALEQPAS